jgi:hypothetical protein
MQVFDVPGFGVLLAGIALFYIYECVSVVYSSNFIPDQDSIDHYAVKIFTQMY